MSVQNHALGASFLGGLASILEVNERQAIAERLRDAAVFAGTNDILGFERAVQIVLSPLLRPSADTSLHDILLRNASRLFEAPELHAALYVSEPPLGNTGIVAYGSTNALSFLKKVRNGKNLSGALDAEPKPTAFYYVPQNLLLWGVAHFFEEILKLPLSTQKHPSPVQTLLPLACIQNLTHIPYVDLHRKITTQAEPKETVGDSSVVWQRVFYARTGAAGAVPAAVDVHADTVDSGRVPNPDDLRETFQAFANDPTQEAPLPFK